MRDRECVCVFDSAYEKEGGREGEREREREKEGGREKGDFVNQKLGGKLMTKWSWVRIPPL